MTSWRRRSAVSQRTYPSIAKSATLFCFFLVFNLTIYSSDNVHHYLSSRTMISGREEGRVNIFNDLPSDVCSYYLRTSVDNRDFEVQSPEYFDLKCSIPSHLDTSFNW